jgi:hypothetical protein
MDEMTGLMEHAPMDTRVACVRDLFERVTVDGREGHAVATSGRNRPARVLTGRIQ